MLAYLLVPIGLVAIGLGSSRGRSSTNGGSAGSCRSVNLDQRRRSFPTNRKGPGHREPIDCPPVPWMPERVNEVILKGLEEGVREERALVLMALHSVYDETVDGNIIQWPTVPGDCAALKAIEERTRIRVRRLLAAHEDFDADEVYKL